MELFLKSLNTYGDVFIFARVSRSSSTTKEIVERHGHRYILFHEPFTVNNEMLSGAFPKIYFIRFVIYEYALRHLIHPSFTHIFISDVNDVIFQSPQVNLPKLLTHSTIYPAMEFAAWNGTNYASKINRAWLQDCSTSFHKAIRKSRHDSVFPSFIKQWHMLIKTAITQIMKCIKNPLLCNQSSQCLPLLDQISCAGTLIGPRTFILAYLSHFTSLHNYSIYCNDQGLHNIILNYPIFIDKKSIYISPPNAGPILTMAYADYNSIRVSKVNGEVEGSESGKSFAVLHHYNRCEQLGLTNTICKAIKVRIKNMAKD